ncbi:hypothetical protein GM661_00490 [Iocasia frigidifontis]|uniref:Phage head morphogenesis domain-containing protein n=1 Tax=Iocasia fonsfrigidae TaxID=2682810 RepID=A0A8A7K5G5_9FIRM|nr:phage minor head protein [Iocasia fonsfrigidae]QTL96551.1 hypothetical protein GM661_00490 [Iocasia fonsfrigidae]
MANIDLSDEFERLQAEIDKISDTGARRIAKEYANALEELRTIVRKAYDKHGTEGELTYEEMVKYDRLKQFNKELTAAIKVMHVQTSKITRKILKDTYKTSFESVRGAVGQAAGKTIRGIVKQEVINEALQNPVSGLTLNDRLKVRRSRIITDIQETIGQGLYKGESYTDMSRRLKDSLEGDIVKSHRIVRTESHRVMEKSKMDSLEHAANQGVNLRKYWLTSEDERVRSSHNHMGEKYSKENAIPIDENFVNDKTGGEGPSPGQLGTAKDDIHCRCISVTIVITDNDTDDFENKEESDIIIPEAKSVKEAEKWAQDNYNLNVSYKDISTEMANANNKAIKKMYGRFPQLNDVNINIRTMKAKSYYGKTVVGWDSKTGRLKQPDLRISKVYFKDSDTFWKQLRKDLDSNFHYPGHNEQSTMVHELTHILEYKMQLNKYGYSDMQVISRVEAQKLLHGIGNIAKSIKEEVLENMGLPQYGSETAKKLRELGEYSRTSDREFLAEAIADAVVSENPLDISKETLKVLERRMRE